MADSAGVKKRFFSTKSHPVIWVGLLTCIFSVTLGYAFVSTNRLVAVHAPLADAAMEVRYNVVQAHLWFEEAISGEGEGDLSKAWEFLNKAEWFALGMLEGRDRGLIKIIPVKNPRLKTEIRETLDRLDQFRSLAKTRWAAYAESGIGSDIDQQFDEVFRQLVQQTEEMETSLQLAIRADVQQFRTLQTLLIAGCLAAGIFVAFVLTAYERGKRRRIRELYESRESLFVTLNSIGDGVIATDIAGCVTRMNPVAASLTGWSEAEALQKPLQDIFRIVHAHTRKAAVNPVDRVLREGVTVGLANHTALISRDGAEYQIADSAAPIRNANGKMTGVVLVFRDVTEEYAQEERLRRSEAKYRTFFEKSRDAMVVVENRKFVECNMAAVELLGYEKKEDLLHRSPAEFSPEFQMDGVPSEERGEEMVRQAIEHGSWRQEWDHVRCDGTIVPVELSLTAIEGENDARLQIILRDLTDQRRAERALSVMEKTLLSIFSASPVGIGRTKGRVFVDVNPRISDLTGYGREELVGKSTRILYPTDEDFLAVGRSKDEMLAEAESCSFESCWRCKDGRILNVLLSFAALDGKDHPAETTFTVLDISEQKRTVELFHAIFNKTFLFGMILDMDGKILEINERVLQVTGPQAENAVGEMAWDAVWWNDFSDVCEKTKKAVESAKDGHSVIDEVRFVDQKGECRQGMRIFTPIMDQGGQLTCINVVGMDITERKEAEEKILRQQYQLEKAQALGLIGSWEFDIRQNKLDWTDETYRIFEIPLGTSLDYDVFIERVHPDDRKEVNRKWQAAVAGKPYDIEHRLLIDDKIKWVREKADIRFDEKNEAIYAIGFCQDITGRKNAEEELLKAQDFLREVLDCLPVGVAVNSVSPVSFEYMNENFCRFYGVTREQLAAPDKFWDAVYQDPEFREEIKRRVEEDTASGDPEQMRWENIPIIRPGEEPRYISARNALIKDRNMVISTVWDVTDRWNAQRQVEWLSRFPEENPNPVLRITTDQVVVYANHGAEELLTCWSCQVGEKLPDDIFRTVEESMEKGVRQIEIACGTKTFSLIFAPVVASGYVNIYGQDITSRKQAEDARGRLTQAIEQAAEIIVITDEQAMIEYVNPAFEQITGYSRQEVVGKNPSLLKSGEHSEEFYKELWRTLSAGRPWNGRLVNKKKDGTLYTEEATISPVIDEDGNIIHYVAAKFDVTHEMELEEQLRQAQKMEAVGQMAGGIAHDFNNLLQVICGYVELLQMTSSAKEDNKPLAEISKAAQRGSTLVSQLLAFSRRQVMHLADLNMNVVVESLLQMIRGMLGERIELSFVPGYGLATVHGDRGLMEQVLMNLCINARDAMPQGGKLMIETGNVLIDEEYAQTHSWAPLGRCVMISVTDTGCGMDKTTVEKIFEPFFTTKEVGKGTGLGLSMVYGIIKQHEGQVNVYSEVGKGTVFKIYLPSVERRASDIPQAAPARIVGGTETILLAEDDPAVLQLAELMLSEAGYNVLTASDGREALRIFEKHMDEIDFVFFDVVMPKLGGKEAMNTILEKRPNLPHLYASGYSENAVHTNFIKDPNVHLINKPYRADTLLHKIRELLDQ